MKLYHGTTIENALSILSEKRMIGTKKFSRHPNTFVSLTSDLMTAQQFGDVLFSFPLTNLDVVEVDYEDSTWPERNKEITEYIFGGLFEELNEDLTVMVSEQEYIARDEITFEYSDVEVLLCGYSKDELEDHKKKIRDVVGEQIKIQVKHLKDNKPLVDEKWNDDLQNQIADLSKLIDEIGIPK